MVEELKAKALCNLNYCSDANNKQYPDCEVEPYENMPTVCPKRDCVQNIFTRPREEELESLVRELLGMLKPKYIEIGEILAKAEKLLGGK